LLTQGLRKPLLLDKPVNGWTSSKAALQSEAGQGSKREGLTQGKLDSSMSGPARKSRIAEMHWSYSRRQQASCKSKLRRPVQCWQHLDENFLPEVRKAPPMLQKTPLIRSRTLSRIWQYKAGLKNP
jgi:hypothetical protein